MRVDCGRNAEPSLDLMYSILHYGSYWSNEFRASPFWEIWILDSVSGKEDSTCHSPCSDGSEWSSKSGVYRLESSWLELNPRLVSASYSHAGCMESNWYNRASLGIGQTLVL